MLTELDDDSEIGDPKALKKDEEDSPTNTTQNEVAVAGTSRGELQALQQDAKRPVTIMHMGTGDIHYHVTTADKDFREGVDEVLPSKYGKRSQPSIKFIQPKINAGVMHCGAGDMNFNADKGSNAASTTSSETIVESSQRNPKTSKISIIKSKAKLYIEKMNKAALKSTEHDVRSTFKNLGIPEKEVYPGLSVISCVGEETERDKDVHYDPESSSRLKPGVGEKPVPIERLHESVDGKAEQHVMLLGDTGDGKTTAAMRYARLALNHKVEALKDVELVHFIRASKLQSEVPCTAFDLLFSQQVSQDAGITAEENLAGKEWIEKNPNKVLIVVDGLDQSRESFDEDYANIAHDTKAKPNSILYNLFNGRIFSGMWILTTTRWHVVWRMTSEVRPKRTIALQGYSMSTVEYLIKSLVGKRGASVLGHLKAKSPILLSLCEIPMFLVFVSEVMTKEKGDLPDRLAAILVSVLNHFQASGHSSVDIQDLMKKLMKLAYMGIIRRKVLFSYSEMSSLGLDMASIRDLVITEAAPDPHQFRVMEGDLELYFCHQSIQEVLAALHIANLSLSEVDRLLKMLLEEPHMEVVCRLFLGIVLNGKTAKKAEKFVKAHAHVKAEMKSMVLKKLKQLIVKKISGVKLLSILHECGESVCDIYERKIQVINLSDVFLKPAVVHAVLSVARQCQRLQMICFGNLRLTSKTLPLFHECLNTLSSIEDTDAEVKAVLTPGELKNLRVILKEKDVSHLKFSCVLSKFLKAFCKQLKPLLLKMNILELNETKIMDSEAEGCLVALVHKKVQRIVMKSCDISLHSHKAKVEMKGALNRPAIQLIIKLLKHLKSSTTICGLWCLDSVLSIMSKVDAKFQMLEINLEATLAKKQMACDISLQCSASEDADILAISSNHGKSGRTYTLLAEVMSNFQVKRLKMNDVLFSPGYDEQKKMTTLTFPDNPKFSYLDLVVETGIRSIKVKNFEFGVKFNGELFIWNDEVVGQPIISEFWKCMKVEKANLRINNVDMLIAWNAKGEVRSIEIRTIRSGNLKILKHVVEFEAAIAKVTVLHCEIVSPESKQALEDIGLLQTLAIYHCFKVVHLEVKHELPDINKAICNLLNDSYVTIATISGVQIEIKSAVQRKILHVRADIGDFQHLTDILQRTSISQVEANDFHLNLQVTPKYRSMFATPKHCTHAESYTMLCNFLIDYEVNQLKLNNILLTVYYLDGIQSIHLENAALEMEDKKCLHAILHFMMTSGASSLKINDLSFQAEFNQEKQVINLDVDKLQNDEIPLINIVLDNIKVETLFMRKCEFLEHSSSFGSDFENLRSFAKVTEVKIENMEIKVFSHKTFNDCLDLLDGLEVENFEIFHVIQRDEVKICYNGKASLKIPQINLASLSELLKNLSCSKIKDLKVSKCVVSRGEIFYENLEELFMKLFPEHHLDDLKISVLHLQCRFSDASSEVIEAVKALKIRHVQTDDLSFLVDIDSSNKINFIEVEHLHPAGIQEFLAITQQAGVETIYISKCEIISEDVETTNRELECMRSLQTSSLEISLLKVGISFYDISRDIMDILIGAMYFQVKRVEVRDGSMEIVQENETRVMYLSELMTERARDVFSILKTIGVDVIKISRCKVGPPHYAETVNQIKALGTLSSKQLNLILDVMASTTQEQIQQELETWKTLAEDDSIKTEVKVLEVQGEVLIHSQLLFCVAECLQVNDFETAAEKFSICYDENGYLNNLGATWISNLSSFHQALECINTKHAIIIKMCEISTKDHEQTLMELELLEKLITAELVMVDTLKLECNFSTVLSQLVHVMRYGLKELKTADLELELQYAADGKHIGLKIMKSSLSCREEMQKVLALTNIKFLQALDYLLQLSYAPLKINVLYMEKNLHCIKQIMDLAIITQTESVQLLDFGLKMKYSSAGILKDMAVSYIDDNTWEEFICLLQSAPENVCIENLHFQHVEQFKLDELESVYDTVGFSFRNIKVVVMHSDYLSFLAKLLEVANVDTLHICQYETEGVNELQHFLVLLDQCNQIKIDALKVMEKCEIHDITNITKGVSLKYLETFDKQCVFEYGTTGEATRISIMNIRIEDLVGLCDISGADSLFIQVCQVESAAALKSIQNPTMQKSVEIDLLDIQCRFEELFAEVDFDEILHINTVKTYDGSLKVTFCQNGKVKGFQFVALHSTKWMKLHETKGMKAILDIEYLQIGGESDEELQQELLLAQKLACNEITKIGCINYKGFLKDGLEQLIDVVKKTQTRLLKTSDAEFFMKGDPDDKVLTMTVPAMEGGSMVKFFETLLNSKIEAVNMNEFLRKLRAFLTSHEIQLQIEVVKVGKNFIDIARKIIKIAEVVPVLKIDALDMEVQLQYDFSGKITLFELSKSNMKQVQTVLNICKKHEIPAIMVHCCVMENLEHGMQEELCLIEETITASDISVRVKSIETSCSFYKHPTVHMDIVKKYSMDHLTARDGDFHFQHDSSGMVSSVNTPHLNSKNWVKFTDVFQKVALVKVECFQIHIHGDKPNAAEIELLEALNDREQSPFEVARFEMNCIFEDVSDFALKQLQKHCHVKTLDTDIRTYFDASMTATVAEICNKVSEVIPQVANIIKILKPKRIKLNDYELELNYYENGQVKMEAFNTWQSDTCINIQDIAQKANIDIVVGKNFDFEFATQAIYDHGYDTSATDCIPLGHCNQHQVVESDSYDTLDLLCRP